MAERFVDEEAAGVCFTEVTQLESELDNPYQPPQAVSEVLAPQGSRVGCAFWLWSVVLGLLMGVPMGIGIGDRVADHVFEWKLSQLPVGTLPESGDSIQVTSALSGIVAGIVTVPIVVALTCLLTWLGRERPGKSR